MSKCPCRGGDVAAFLAGASLPWRCARLVRRWRGRPEVSRNGETADDEATTYWIEPGKDTHSESVNRFGRDVERF
jgi:hypothetical protein